MKTGILIIIVLALSGCIKSDSIEFTGITPGIKNGVFIIKTKGDSTIYGENIKDGKFALSKRQLKYPGYYTFNITDTDHPDDRSPFEIYLEGGKYTIETQARKLYQYPKITSGSKIQNDLSSYFTLNDKLITTARGRVNQLNNEVNDKGNGLSKTAYSALLNKLSTTENKMNDIGELALKQFVKDHPNSIASAHIMAGLNYEGDPVSYYTIFKTLSPEARNSDEGKEVGKRLSQLVKLVAGANAPFIYGKTPDGKIFDRNTVNKKLILVDFWRAGNDFSRQNHQKFIELLSNIKNKDSFGIVSVSMDTTRLVDYCHYRRPSDMDTGFGFKGR
jgi:hypothetical protein